MIWMKKNEYLTRESENDPDSDNTYQTTFKVSQTPKINQLINESRFDDALSLINNILKSDDDWRNWNLKAIILDNLSRYDESIECYNRALTLNQSVQVKINKANTLYKYAKVTFFPEGNYEKALDLIGQSLDIMPESEDASELHFLKAEILEALGRLGDAQKSYLIAHKEFDKLDELERQMDYLENTDDTIVNITGSYFYDFTPSQGLIVDLMKEEDNEHDSDAIAVCLDGEKIGYVANSEYTLMDGANSASQIKNKIGDNAKAEILFVYLQEYVVAKII